MSQFEHSHHAPITPLTLQQRLWVFTILARLRELSSTRFKRYCVIFIISTAFAIAIGVFRENKGRSWAHAANIAALRYTFDPKWDLAILRSFTGATTSQAYQKWARLHEQEILTDLLPEGAKLHWVGPRRAAGQDRVFLYFHGESRCLCIYMTRSLISFL